MNTEQITAVINAFSLLASASEKCQNVSKFEYEDERVRCYKELREAGFPEEVWGHFYDLSGCINPF